MIYLFLSLFVLFLTPMIEQWSHANQKLKSATNSFLFVVLVAVVVGDIIPHSIHSIGWLAIPLILVGLFGPSTLERVFSGVAQQTHQITLLVATCGLLLHAMIDGALLNDYANVEQSSWLPIAILLHRLPLAVMLCVILKPSVGLRGAYMGLMAIGIFTLFGFVLGIQLAPVMTSNSFAVMQSFVAGTLLHVLLHQPHRDHHKRHDDPVSETNVDQHSTFFYRLRSVGRYHFVGGFFAVLLLIFMVVIAPPHHHVSTDVLFKVGQSLTLVNQ